MVLRGVNMRKLAPGQVSHQDDFLILHRVYMFAYFFIVPWPTWWCHPKLPNYAALPIPVYQQTNFTLKQVVVSHLHHTVAKFCTWVKFSLWDYWPGWTHAGVTWHFVVVSCKQIQSHGNQSELVPAQKLPKCHVNTPKLLVRVLLTCNFFDFVDISLKPSSFLQSGPKHDSAYSL